MKLEDEDGYRNEYRIPFYLSDHNQFLYSCDTQFKFALPGVPQGLVFAPLRFRIYLPHLGLLLRHLGLVFSLLRRPHSNLHVFPLLSLTLGTIVNAYLAITVAFLWSLKNQP